MTRRRHIFALEEPTDDLSALGELLRSLGWIDEDAPRGVHLLGRTVEARAEVIRAIFRRMVARLPRPAAPP
ncbi:hypothetical protein [Paremcibacter congregatus]|jgi:hypothetical protein|uniref:hypothetical protein n=1 Tax=Paremcibacter congregatus TaxID=2043170 RepID=UPI0030EED70F|tara:strand:+ start:4285 stop:4497 length:213 start_codon:yes stop_codon:yes gene_type:complete